MSLLSYISLNTIWAFNVPSALDGYVLQPVAARSKELQLCHPESHSHPKSHPKYQTRLNRLGRQQSLEWPCWHRFWALSKKNLWAWPHGLPGPNSRSYAKQLWVSNANRSSQDDEESTSNFQPFDICHALQPRVWEQSHIVPANGSVLSAILQTFNSKPVKPLLGRCQSLHIFMSFTCLESWKIRISENHTQAWWMVWEAGWACHEGASYCAKMSLRSEWMYWREIPLNDESTPRRQRCDRARSVSSS